MSFYGGKRALITGGSSGIGLAIARALAGAQADVAICARDEARLEAALAQIRSASVADRQRFAAVRMDVTSTASVEAGARRTLAELGGVDVLINAAGFAIPGTVDERRAGPASSRTSAPSSASWGRSGIPRTPPASTLSAATRNVCGKTCSRSA